MRPIAKPYREGKTWSVRVQRKGHDIYLPSFPSPKAAEEAMRQKLADLGFDVPSKHGSPFKLTVAQALRLYALERLPFMKGAPQEARRINRYLDAAQMARIVCEPIPAAQQTRKYFNISVAPGAVHRSPPASLRDHRSRMAQRTACSDRLRAVLARTAVAKVTRHQLQALIDALGGEGLAPATVALERALLRRLMNYARTVWHWPITADNPGTGLTMETIDNRRERVLSHAEEGRLEAALAECRNREVAPAVILLLETAMRSSEPLERATWADVDWSGCLLRLREAKAGKRKVPLSERALEALRALGPGEPDAPILTLSYESLKAAWRRVCKRAGIENLNLHDLRHTAATRMALASGNVFLVQALTGHKTLSQLERYINVTAEDVVQFQRSTRSTLPAPAPGEIAPPAPTPAPAPAPQASTAAVRDVVPYDYGRRRA